MSQASPILAVDLGGTKVNLAVAQVLPPQKAGGLPRLELGKPTRYASHEFKGLEAILQAHFGGKPPALGGVGIGVAGPIDGRKVKVTNLPWSLDGDELERYLGAPVSLINDLEAVGYALPYLEPQHCVTLQAGKPKLGNQAVIAAGTGLGECIAVRGRDGRMHVSATEGGHAGFSPSSPGDVALAGFLIERYKDHVSWERVVSGIDGFRNLYTFLQSSGQIDVGKGPLANLGPEHDIGAAVITAATAGDPAAKTIIQWFIRLYGSETGNLALKGLSTGGMFIGGGLAPRLLPWFQDGTFLAAFAAKGRFQGLLREMPVTMITDPDIALRGAAACAYGAATEPKES